jgi:uncharacterized protein (TIGR02145 family)/prepilin-type N-terminal cleavage/methylation domain-containing protein
LIINNKNMKKAFTLIELLVVIAIIGILSTLSIVALQQVRSSARDVRRVADMKQVQTALELFLYENGRYPTEEEWSSGSVTSAVSSTTFMYVIPSAPIPPDGDCDENENAYSYNPSPDLRSYEISFCTGRQMAGILPGTLCMTPGGLAKECDSLIPDACDDIVSISYAGQEYDIVAIGDQCWMAENLNVGTAKLNNEVLSTSTPEKYCYGATDTEVDPSGNCAVYGGLYTWEAAMQGATTPGAQGVCPSGWHIPSESDWNSLTNYLSSDNNYWCDGNSDYIAKSLADNSSWNSSTNLCAVGNNLSLNNLSGFSALGVGLRTHTSSFVNIGNHGLIWSSFAQGYFLNIGRSLVTAVHRGETYSSLYGLSVRCVKD